MITLNKNERGALNALLIPLIVVGLLFVGTLAFALMAFSSGQDYKKNSDEKSAVAVAKAVKETEAKKTAEFLEASNSDMQPYNGPSAYGSLVVQYPKAWSAYIVEQNNSGASYIDGYFNPNYVPSVTAQGSSFALRLKVVNQSYATVMQAFQGNIKTAKIAATPYAFPKVPTVVGTKLTGEIAVGKQGSMVIVPLRENTLQVWTESTDGNAVFETKILPNLSYSP